ncbi:unnamed protein product [Parajaminaea phylloscopi]
MPSQAYLNAVAAASEGLAHGSSPPQSLTSGWLQVLNSTMGAWMHKAGWLAFAAFNAASASRLPYADLSFNVDAFPRGDATSHNSSSGKAWPSNLHLAVDYYPSQWDEKRYWESDAARMKNASISYVRIGEFDWALFEPQDGVYNWTMMDKSFDLLHRHGLKVILGTPAETPPLWAVQNYDILPKDANRDFRRFGSRHHFSFSSPDYRKLNKRITEQLAKRYGSHPALGAWQLSNEFTCHATGRTWDDHAKHAFQGWLQNKYGDIETLNRRQGRVFWSSQFYNFSDIDVPTQEVTESNPAHRLDWFTFSSDQVISFAKESSDAIRRYSDAPITTNFMGGETSFDHHKLQHVVQLSFAALDSYPLGNLESSAWQSDAKKAKNARVGDEDFQSFHFELMRSMGQNKAWGIMEQQPGPVNWAPTNPSPLVGMVRLWIHEMFAHGGSMANIFRWREVPFAQEQMHAGMLRRDNVEDLAFKEQQQVVAELNKMQEAGLLEGGDGSSKAPSWVKESKREASKVALLYDYSAAWLLEANPQGGVWETNTFKDFPFVFFELVSNWYSALRRLGLDVDIVGQYGDFSKYDLIVAPSIPLIGSELEKRLENYNGSLIVGPRSASKEDVLSIPEGLPPSAGPLRERIPMKVVRVESLRSDAGDQVTNTLDGSVHNVTVWSEWLECERGSKNSSDSPEFVFKGYRDGAPASCKHTSSHGTTRYIGWYALQDSLLPIFAKAAEEAGIKTVAGSTPSAENLDLGESVRFTRHGKALYVVNYATKENEVRGVPADATLVFGGVDGDRNKVAPAGVNVYKMA